MNQILIPIILSACVLLLCLFLKKRENFNIPEGKSSAWEWNDPPGPGYGSGYGTGYGKYGIWPSMIYGVPWRSWMWGRRPSEIAYPFVPMPQIDYDLRSELSNSY